MYAALSENRIYASQEHGKKTELRIVRIHSPQSRLLASIRKVGVHIICTIGPAQMNSLWGNIWKTKQYSLKSGCPQDAHLAKTLPQSKSFQMIYQIQWAANHWAEGKKKDPLKHGESEVEGTGRSASYVATLHLITFKNTWSPPMGTKNMLGYLSIDIMCSLQGTGNVRREISDHTYYCTKSMPGLLPGQEGYQITTSL